jgi:hypothetical protein
MGPADECLEETFNLVKKDKQERVRIKMETNKKRH